MPVKSNIENEIKVMINENQYGQLISKYKLKPKKQINRYYKNIYDETVRIREYEDGHKVFAYKTRRNGKLYEYEVSDTEKDYDAKVEEIKKTFGLTNVQYIGNLITERAKIDLGFGEVCVDKNTYLGKVDYEIEHELYNAIVGNHYNFYTFLKENNIEFIENKINKFTRFQIELEKCTAVNVIHSHNVK